VGVEHVGDTGLGSRILLKRISENKGVAVWITFKILMQTFVNMEVILHDKIHFFISLVKEPYKEEPII
jgi:hypothetical protein